MGLLSKIKGIFIEEVNEDDADDEKEEQEITVAKKIENKDRDKERERESISERRVDREKKETLELDSVKEEEKRIQEEKMDETKEFEKKNPNEFKFSFSDDDFKVEDENVEVPKVEEPKKEVEEPKENVVLYHQSSYTTVKDNYKETSYHEVYEANGKREEKHTFQRSPIISPVWGILDKNYKKEEIVPKKEIRLTTNNKKADLDAVREKVYGDIANDISSSIEEKTSKKEDTSEEDNLLYDLSENSGPSVKKVTMEDAEEYYSDLGLEYNVDYKMEKEEPKEDDGKELELVQDNLEKEDHKEEDEKEDEDDNLFDLIDSMYEDKE